MRWFALLGLALALAPGAASADVYYTAVQQPNGYNFAFTVNEDRKPSLIDGIDTYYNEETPYYVYGNRVGTLSWIDFSHFNNETHVYFSVCYDGVRTGDPCHVGDTVVVEDPDFGRDSLPVTWPVARIGFTPDTVYLSPAPLYHAGAAPEPSSWALIITGVGLAGAALRRRKAAYRFAQAGFCHARM